VKLKRRKDGSQLKAAISKVLEEDFDYLAKSNEYVFDWRLEKYSDLYKLYLLSDRDSILGMMSLDDYPDSSRINISLIEVSKTNRGNDRIYENIAGCLIAFALKIAFQLGYNGYVTIEPKNEKLLKYYEIKYGFQAAGYMMYLKGSQSEKLIKMYLNE